MYRVLVTRAAGQASKLAEALSAQGAEAVVIPTIEIVGPSDDGPLRQVVKTMQRARADGAPCPWDVVVFTSANAVRAFAEGSRAAPVGCRVASIGPATSAALREVGIRPEFEPQVASPTAESLAELLTPEMASGARRFLFLRAEEGRDVIPEALRAAGAEVTVVAAYRTVVPEGAPAAVRGLFGDAEGWPDAVTFTSSSTARHFFALLERAGVSLQAGPPVMASIGPVTSETVQEFGFDVDVEASRPDVEVLARELVVWLEANARK